MQKIMQQTKLYVWRTEAHGPQARVFRFEISHEPISFSFVRSTRQATLSIDMNRAGLMCVQRRKACTSSVIPQRYKGLQSDKLLRCGRMHEKYNNHNQACVQGSKTAMKANALVAC